MISKKTLTAIVAMLILASLFSLVIIASINQITFRDCKSYRHSYDVIFEDNTFIDKCLIKEDGEELTINQYYKKHKFDGIEVRR